MASSTPYFSSILSESAFKTRFQAENGKHFSQLENVAASYWGRAHLLACRVVRRETQRNFLPALSRHIKPSDIQSPSGEITTFLEGPNLSLMAKSEHYIVRSSNCSLSVAQIWAAMATFKGSRNRRKRETASLQEQAEMVLEDDDLETRDTKRLRRATLQPGFIDSSGIQVGSSSPLHYRSYSGSQGSSLGYVDHDMHVLGRTPEDDTLRLASCVIRHILYFSAPQDSESQPIVVEFRDAKTRVAATTLIEERQIVAIDDGGLCLRQQMPGGEYILVKNHVAILEAKTQFHCLENGLPVISDKSFAQIICEALATRLSDMTNNSQQRYAPLIIDLSLYQFLRSLFDSGPILTVSTASLSSMRLRITCVSSKLI